MHSAMEMDPPLAKATTFQLNASRSTTHVKPRTNYAKQKRNEKQKLQHFLEEIVDVQVSFYHFPSYFATVN